MCETEPTTVVGLVQDLFDDHTIDTYLRDSGLIERQRRLNGTALLWVLLFGWTAQRRSSLACLHRLYSRRCEVELSYPAWRQKLAKPACAEFLKRCCWRVLNYTAQHIPKPGAGNAKWLSDAVAIDSTIISLRPELRPLWKATWKGGASLKLSVVYNVVHGCTMDLSLCQGTRHDTKAIKPVGPWVKDRLVLMDLGYWALRTFKAINKHGGFFISRLKSGKIVRIVSDNMPAGPGSMELYRLRWQVELLFKCMRSVAQIDQMPSADPNIVRALVWASILRVALGELVCLMARQKAGMVRGTLRNLRAQLVWREMQLEVLNALLKPLRSGLDDFRWLFRHACDPNHTRGRPTDVLTKLGPDGLFPL